MLVSMTTRLMLTRPWLYGVSYGVFAGLFYGIVMGTQKRISHPDQYSWGDAAVEGFALGAFFGTAMGVGAGWIKWRHRHDPGRDELRAVGRRDQKVAVRAVYRGPVPDDPAVRDVALRLASDMLARSNDQRPLTYALFGLMIAVGSAFAIFSSAWYWLAVAGFLGLLAYVLLLPRRLDRRVALLGARYIETAQ